MSKKKKGLIESLKSLLGLDQKPEYMGPCAMKPICLFGKS